MRHPSLITVLSLAALAACRFGAEIPAGAYLTCKSLDDCTSDRVCIATTCVPRDSPCIVVHGDAASVEPDGNACEGAKICLSGSCVAPTCGDGIVSLAEQCDGGALCRADCTAVRCGDGVIDDGEGCDDGDENSDTLADACRTRCGLPTCGDGVIDGDEACDNGAQNDDLVAGACRRGCVLPACGDGVRDPGEACDEGVQNSDSAADACRNTCVRARCGDGVVDTNEVCDGSVDCRSDCLKIAACGDGEIDREQDEQCDDANANPRDGCDACRTQGWVSDLLVTGQLEGIATEVAVAPTALALARDGRVFIADGINNRVRRLDTDGTLTTIAGTGFFGFSGDGAAATSAELASPQGVAVDALGRVYIADSGNLRIRRVDVDGTITTIAGDGTSGITCEHCDALTAKLSGPTRLAVDTIGALYVADQSRIFRIDLDGTFQTAVANLIQPRGLAFDGQGRLLICERQNNHVVRADLADGSVTIIAGRTATFDPNTGEFDDPLGDGGPAVEALVALPEGVFVDVLGRIVIAEAGPQCASFDVCTGNRRVRRIDVDGTISTIAGTGLRGYSGDGGLATLAEVNRPRDVVVDNAGRILVADEDGARLRVVDGAGLISTIAGSGTPTSAGDGAAATSADLPDPVGVAVDSAGRLLVVDGRLPRVRRIDADGIITTVAGGGADSPADGGLAIDAALGPMTGIAIDSVDRIYVLDSTNLVVRRIDTDGTIHTVAGDGTSGNGGDGGPATQAQFLNLGGLAIDSIDRIYVADPVDARVRRVNEDGTIETIAGNGELGFDGEGGPAILAQLAYPVAIAIDGDDLVDVLEFFGRVTHIDADGNIHTIVGDPTLGFGFTGDGGPATAATFNFPSGLTIGGQGDLFITDTINMRVRRVDQNGIIDTIVGSTPQAVIDDCGFGPFANCEPPIGLWGDGGRAVDARLFLPFSTAFDAAGRLLVLDAADRRIRRVDDDGTISTIAGGIHPSGPGPLSHARVYGAKGLASFASVIFSVGDFGRVMSVDLTRGVLDVVAGFDDAAVDALHLAAFAPPIDDARGIAVDTVAGALVITEAGTGSLRVITFDADHDGSADDAATWETETVPTQLATPSGIAFDPADETLVVVDSDLHCVQRLDRGGVVLATVFGVCGARGSFPGFLNNPTHVAISPVSDAVYIADTDNNKVIRVAHDGTFATVIGEGSPSSAGDGQPARLFPVNHPGQIALDAFGNLFVTSTTTVRMIANVDGDADADADDSALTIYGGGDRTSFPESDSKCMSALTVDNDGVVYAADACQGFVVALRSVDL